MLKTCMKAFTSECGDLSGIADVRDADECFVGSYPGPHNAPEDPAWRPGTQRLAISNETD